MLRARTRPIYQTRLRCADVVPVYFAHQALSVISRLQPQKCPCFQGRALRSMIRSSLPTNLYNLISHELMTLSILRPLQSRKMVLCFLKLKSPIRRWNRLTGLRAGHLTRLREAILALIKRFYAHSRSPFDRYLNAVSIIISSHSANIYSVTTRTYSSK